MVLVTVLILATIILLAFGSIIWLSLQSSVPLKGTTNIPGPKVGYTLPIIGDAWRFALDKDLKGVMETVERFSEQVEKAVSLWFGPRLVIFVKDPIIGEAILSSPKASMKDPDAYLPFNLLSDGVIPRNGKPWASLRIPLDKMMHTSALEKYQLVSAKKSEELVEEVSNKCDKGSFDIFETTACYVVDTVLETLYGVPSNSDSTFPKMVDRATNFIVKLVVNPLYKFKWFSSLPTVKKDLEEIQSQILDLGKQYTASRLQILGEREINPNDPNFQPECYFDFTMKVAREERPDDSYHIYTMGYDVLAAGFDTTVTTVATCILFLAMHPEYQEKAFKEQIEIMGDSLRPPFGEELSKMNYLWMTTQECLRHIGIPGIFRLIGSELKIDGYTFPEGCSVFLSLRSFHMNPKYWTKSKEFYPDHFLPQNVAARPKGAWLPFAKGARVCPGKGFAKNTVLTFLSMLLRRFKYTTQLKFHEMDYEFKVVLKSVKGYPVEATRRQPDREM